MTSNRPTVEDLSIVIRAQESALFTSKCTNCADTGWCLLGAPDTPTWVGNCPHCTEGQARMLEQHPHPHLIRDTLVAPQINNSLTTVRTEHGRQLYSRLWAAVQADVPVRTAISGLVGEGLTGEEVEAALNTCREYGH